MQIYNIFLIYANFQQLFSKKIKVFFIKQDETLRHNAESPSIYEKKPKSL